MSVSMFAGNVEGGLILHVFTFRGMLLIMSQYKYKYVSQQEAQYVLCRDEPDFFFSLFL